jgi:hypothetical protein
MARFHTVADEKINADRYLLARGGAPNASRHGKIQE